jgi:hypothetical protein
MSSLSLSVYLRVWMCCRQTATLSLVTEWQQAPYMGSSAPDIEWVYIKTELKAILAEISDI